VGQRGIVVVVSLALTTVPRERLRAAADLLIDYPFRVWHYGESTGLEGLLEAARLLAEPRYEAWVHGLLRGWAARRLPFAEIDNTLPGKVLCDVAARHGDEHLLEAALDAARHLTARRTIRGVALPFERAPLREPFGGEPLGAADRALLDDPGPGIFVDALHFDPPFLVRLGVLAGKPELVDAGARQALALTELLQDDTGLFWHFFLERSGERYGLGWGRGQGWALLGLVDVLRPLPRDHADREQLACALERLAGALAAGQRADGGWYAVIGDPESGDESSTAAFAAAGLSEAVAAGLLAADHLEVARRAWSHTADRVREDGVLAGVSANVWACTAASHYRHMPLDAVVPWGQGPLLLAAAQAREGWA
jgi:unsaturated rhamnogalacturonyl hydrolase